MRETSDGTVRYGTVVGRIWVHTLLDLLGSDFMPETVLPLLISPFLSLHIHHTVLTANSLNGLSRFVTNQTTTIRRQQAILAHLTQCQY